MRLIFISIILIALVLGPQLWVWWVFRQYRQPRENFPGTGGELARHLLNRFGLQEVRVEPTPMGDHYNPETKSRNQISGPVATTLQWQILDCRCDCRS